jgi:hypothetical protein
MHLARLNIAKGGRSIHVRGSDETRSVAFLEKVVEDACRDGYRIACTVDPDSILTGTPPAALQELARNLGVPSPSKPARPVNVTIGNHARVGGDYKINDVHIVAASDEAEATAELLMAIRNEVSGNRRFDKLLIIFRECHRMSDELRVQFTSNFWKPIVSEMLTRGAVALFQYAPSELSKIGAVVPVTSVHHIDLPHRFANAVTPEIARFALSEGWEATEEAALALARTTLTLSESVSDLYDKLLVLELDRSAP